MDGATPLLGGRQWARGGDQVAAQLGVDKLRAQDVDRGRCTRRQQKGTWWRRWCSWVRRYAQMLLETHREKGGGLYDGGADRGGASRGGGGCSEEGAKCSPLPVRVSGDAVLLSHE
jgi:hypothetical protein